MVLASDVSCPTCKACAGIRVTRSGFLQLNVLGHLGIYPWKCGACGSLFLARNRGPKSLRRRRSDPPDTGEPGRA